MTRSFSDLSVDPSLLRHVLDQARRVPSAGNSQGFDFVVLEGAETSDYWGVSLPVERRETFKWKSLLKAPVIVTIWADPDAYLERYSEEDKVSTGLGKSREAWSTEYWLVDGAFSAMALQYAAINAGLGVLFFGMFDKAPAIARALNVPPGRVPVGTVAIGWPESSGEEDGKSVNRERRPLDAVARNGIVHFGGW
jgi:nitroreductase